MGKVKLIWGKNTAYGIQITELELTKIRAQKPSIMNMIICDNKFGVLKFLDVYDSQYLYVFFILLSPIRVEFSSTFVYFMCVCLISEDNMTGKLQHGLIITRT